MLLPYHPVRSNNILACIFADKAEYLLGIGPRGNKAFAAMKSLQEKLLEDVDSPVAKGILRFFGTWDLSSASDKFSESQKELLAEYATGNILITVNGVPPTEDRACVSAYNAYIKEVGISGSTLHGIDCITGEYVFIRKSKVFGRHPPGLLCVPSITIPVYTPLAGNRGTAHR